MTKLPFVLTLALGVLSLASADTLFGQTEGVSQRVDPFRLLRSRDRAGGSTHSQTEKSPRSLGRRGMSDPVVNNGISQTSSVRQQREYQRQFGSTAADSGDVQRQRLRPRFAQQSNLSATTSQRVARSTQAYPNGSWLGQRTAEQAAAVNRAAGLATQQPTVPPLNQTRGGIRDQGAPDMHRELARAANSRAINQLTNRTQTNGAPNYDQLRSRVSHTGADPRTMNARRGRAPDVMGGSPNVSRFGSSRIRGR